MYLRRYKIMFTINTESMTNTFTGSVATLKFLVETPVGQKVMLTYDGINFELFTMLDNPDECFGEASLKRTAELIPALRIAAIGESEKVVILKRLIVAALLDNAMELYCAGYDNRDADALEKFANDIITGYWNSGRRQA